MPAPLVPRDGDDLTFRHAQIDPAQNIHLAITAAEIGDFEQAHATPADVGVLNRPVGQDRTRRPGRDQPTAIHDEQMRSEGSESGQIVLDDQEAGPARRECPDAGRDLFDQHRVDPGERLVQQNVSRFGH